MLITEKMLASVKLQDSEPFVFFELLSDFVGNELSSQEIVYLYVKSLLNNSSKQSRFMTAEQKTEFGACLFIERLKEDANYVHFFILLSCSEQGFKELCSILDEYKSKKADELFQFYNGLKPYDTSCPNQNLQNIFSNQHHESLPIENKTDMVFFWSPPLH